MDQNTPLIEIDPADLRHSVSFAIRHCPVLPRLKSRPNEPLEAAQDRLVEALVEHVLIGFILNGWHVVRRPVEGQGHSAGFIGWRPTE